MPEVAVTFASLDAEAGALEAARELLDAAEQARAERFRFERDRRRFVMRRAMLRRLLAAHVGGSAEHLEFVDTGFGKPRLPGGPQFSLSHSGDRMMLAVADVEIGADIERIDALLAWEPLAVSLFTSGERAALAALAEPDGRIAFFRCWARKEAFVKALGLGLSYPLHRFVVSIGSTARLLAGAEGWAIAAVDGGEGYAAAIVARDDGLPLVIRASESTSSTASRANAMASAA